MADQLGVTQKTACEWETGKREPHPQNVTDICKLLGVSDPAMLDLVVEPESPGAIPAPVEASDIADFTTINKEVQEFMKHFSASRRKALIVLIGTAGSVLIAPNIEVLPRMAEEILPFCKKNLAECWMLSKGDYYEMLTAKQAVSSYIPVLTALVEQSSKHREQAASLIAQCYRLRSLLSYHLDNLAVATKDIGQAEFYVGLTNDLEMHYDILVHAGLINYYLKRPEEALGKFRQAKRYRNNVSHAIRCVGLRVQAACEAQIGEESKARRSLSQAYRHYEIYTSKAEPALYYACIEDYELSLWTGVTKYHLGDDTALDALEAAQPFTANIPERVRTGIINNAIFTELRRPASQRDLNRLASRWSEANQRANDLQSNLRQDEVRAAYDGLLIAYPGEQRIRELRTVLRKGL
jgi:transcriptional regulator with XRE-family HTH domain